MYVVKREIFDPWLENRLYKGVILSGKWEGGVPSEIAKDKNGKSLPFIKMVLELNQHGYGMSGLFNTEAYTYKNKEGEVSSTYKNFYRIKGTVSNNIARFEYSPISKKRTGLGFFMLEVQAGGNMMSGHALFLAEENNQISNFERVKLERIE
jgi:hypothetical protein